uniref:Nuclear speckle splicing regulatory protein 1 n=1 Tax=Naja naja TaxID=35670 RepID=A0A8C6XMM0_NAJNA
MAVPGKQYGLIFPKKVQQKGLVKHAAFMDDSDEESSIGQSLQKEAAKKQAMKQTKMEIQRALAEDSTVYEYDTIYEDIQQKKAESQASSLAGKAEKKPKYIQNILQAAEMRKKEQERRMEKKIQKERESEGDAFQDKEAFVTAAYKKKLQERAEEEERERKEAAMEGEHGGGLSHGGLGCVQLQPSAGAKARITLEDMAAAQMPGSQAVLALRPSSSLSVSPRLTTSIEYYSSTWDDN